MIPHPRTRRVFVSLSLMLVIPLLTFATGSILPAQAATDFGSGLAVCVPPVQPVVLENPTVVTECTQSGLQAALDKGGQITFDCGGPASIALESQLVLNPAVDTVIDGGGLITLDGQDQTRILFKDWHNPAVVDSVTITLQNLRLVNGRAPAGGSTGDHSGGALTAGHPGTRVHILNSTLENNRTTSTSIEDNQGGALFIHNSYETVISGSVMRGNQAGSGGAMGGIATGLLVFNSIFENNEAVDTTDGGIVRGYGGAIHLDGVTNNYNPDSNHRLHVCGSRFDGNISVRGGGALGVVVSDNKGTLATYERSTFVNNQTQGLGAEFGNGGAIYHIEDDHAGGREELNLEILNSTFHNNQAGRQGGALWLYILGHGRIENNTLIGNSTLAAFDTVGQGGGAIIHLGIYEIVNTLFANNHAAYQAGALHAGGADDPDRMVILTNTIFYNNTLNIGQTVPSDTRWQGFHTNRPMTDGGGNIQHPQYKPDPYNNDVNNWIVDDPIFADPLLGELGMYGGSTRTVPIQENSPAVDAAVEAACPASDQRGYPRLGPCDIGPFEYGSGLFLYPAQVYLPLLSQ